MSCHGTQSDIMYSECVTGFYDQSITSFSRSIVPSFFRTSKNQGTTQNLWLEKICDKYPDFVCDGVLACFYISTGKQKTQLVSHRFLLKHLNEVPSIQRKQVRSVPSVQAGELGEGAQKWLQSSSNSNWRRFRVQFEIFKRKLKLQL